MQLKNLKIGDFDRLEVNVGDINSFSYERDGKKIRVHKVDVFDSDTTLILVVYGNKINDIQGKSSIVIENGVIENYKGELQIKLGSLGWIE